VTVGRTREGDLFANWAEKDRAVVWNAAELATNLANVLQRRMMDGQRNGCAHLPLASRSGAPLGTVAAFIAGEFDDRRVENLLWGLMLVDPRRRSGRKKITSAKLANPPPLPRDYALLKLLFLPARLVPDNREGRTFWRLAQRGESGVAIRPEPRIVPLIRAGRPGEACRIAAQRLRVSGLPPMPGPRMDGEMRDGDWSECSSDHRRAQRLAAALLIPILSSSVNRLIHLVCRDQSTAVEALAVLSKGEFAP
jgi:CRISPR-associated protein Csx17